MADEYKRTTRKRAFGESPDLQALQLALLEQAKSDPRSGNFQPGHTPSGTAMNVFLSTMPLSREQQREQDLLDESDARHMANLEDQRNRDRVLADQRADATARQFDTRRGVEEARMLGPDPVGAPQVRTIRRFRTSPDAVDPDTAATATQKAMRDPRVLAEQVRQAGEVEAAKAKAAGSQPDTTEADATRKEIIRLATELRESDALNRNVGPLDEWIPTLRGSSRDFQAKAQRLRDLLALEARSKLKGQGAVSDFEGRMLANSQTSLRTDVDEGSFTRELDRIIAEQNRRATPGVRRYNPDTGRVE